MFPMHRGLPYLVMLATLTAASPGAEGQGPPGQAATSRQPTPITPGTPAGDAARLPTMNSGVATPLPPVTRPATPPGVIPIPPIFRRPDLVVSISADAKAAAGTDLPVTVTVTNKGTIKALGTSEGPVDKAYMVDLVWSVDSDIPATTAVHPVYQGLTKDDFVEDALVTGGRISNTKSIAPGASVTYELAAYVPKGIEPGTYWLGAYADSIERLAESNETNNTTARQVSVGTAPGTANTVPPGVDFWVLPWAVGNTPLYKIKPTGLTDYTDGLSGRAMRDAPFGARLGFRSGYDSRLPTAKLAYYRWQYRPVGGAWTEFTETIGAHYERKEGSKVTFPVYVLGPKPVNGNNLYEFRPKKPPFSEPGVTFSWPATDWFGDIYSGLLNTSSLPAGDYEFKLEVYDEDGTLVMPGATSFRFLVPTSTAADGTVVTAAAPPAAIAGGGYVFRLHIDNRRTAAAIDAPALAGGSATDDCGFLLYDKALAPTDADARIRLAFHATHPADHAVFAFDVRRATTPVIDVDAEVSAAAAGGFVGDGSGNFSASLLRTQLLGGCEKAAFAEVLSVLPKATTGWGQRITAYDAYAVRAFALAPQ
jgi:hypothetical protein